MSVGSAISSPLGPASCDKDADLVQESVLAGILARNANTESENFKGFNLNGATDRDSFKSKLPMITDKDLQPEIQRIANGDRSPILSAHPIPDSEFPTRRRGGGGGGDGRDGEEGDLEGGGGDEKKLGPTQKMLQLMATTTIANTAQTFGSAISLRDSGLTFSSKILLILVMATGLAGYLFSITAILLMHKRPQFSRVWVWTGCATTALGFLILIVAFVQEL